LEKRYINVVHIILADNELKLAVEFVCLKVRFQASGIIIL